MYACILNSWSIVTFMRLSRWDNPADYARRLCISSVLTVVSEKSCCVCMHACMHCSGEALVVTTSHVTSLLSCRCSWWPGGLWPGTHLLVKWSQTGHPFTDYLILIQWVCEYFNTAAIHHALCTTKCANDTPCVSFVFSGSTPQAELGCSMMPFIIWRRWDNPSSSEKRRRGSHRRWDNPSSGDSTL